MMSVGVAMFSLFGGSDTSTLVRPVGIDASLGDIETAQFGERRQDAEAAQLGEHREAGHVVTRRLSMQMNGSNVPVTLTCPSQRPGGERCPLVLFTGGFATSYSQYTCLAEALAGGGCAVLRYDAPLASFSSDEDQVTIIHSLLDFAAGSATIGELADPSKVLLAGHSRGAKVSSLAALGDYRVRGLCLLDPVDGFILTEGRSGFPSACEAMRCAQGRCATLPVAIVGAGFGGECAPPRSNYNAFYEAASGPAWLLKIPKAGHAQFLDSANGMAKVQNAVCGTGGEQDDHVLEASAAVMLAWTDAVFGGEPLPKCGCLPRSVTNTTEGAPHSGGFRQQPFCARACLVAARTTTALQQKGLQVESMLKA